MKDEQIRDRCVEKFKKEFQDKFNAGIREHNPKGDKGLWRMSKTQLCSSILEEVYDLFAYTSVLILKILADSAADEMKGNNKK